jgi:hypothetical protein
MESPSSLKARTATLCHRLEMFEKEVKAKTIGTEDANQRWESSYKPEALFLAEEMRHYAKDDVSGTEVIMRVGNYREIHVDVLICINTPLSDHYISGHMTAVRDYLRKLADTLPTGAGA